MSSAMAAYEPGSCTMASIVSTGDSSGQNRDRMMAAAQVGDAFLLAIHEKRHTYDPSSPFGAWLATIARYKFIKVEAAERVS